MPDEPQDPFGDLRVATFLDMREDGELAELFDLWGAEVFRKVIAAVWFRLEFVEWRAVILRMREDAGPGSDRRA